MKRLIGSYITQEYVVLPTGQLQFDATRLVLRDANIMLLEPARVLYIILCFIHEDTALSIRIGV